MIVLLLLLKSNVEGAIISVSFFASNANGEDSSKEMILTCNSIAETGISGVRNIIWSQKGK